MDKQKQIEEMTKAMCGNSYTSVTGDFVCGVLSYECNFKCKHFARAERLYNAGYRKIPEGAVVLTDEELNEELDTIKCAMIVHDDDGERYVSYDDYKEFTDRLGKIARQRKARIEQLEKLLDDRCDRCIERVRKETAEKFAEMLKDLVAERNCNEDYDWEDVQVDGQIFVECVDEICKEITEGGNGL